MCSQWDFPLYLDTVSSQFLIASARRPGTWGSLVIVVIGSKYVRTVKTIAPDRGSRRSDWRSDRKWISSIVKPLLFAVAHAALCQY